MQPIIHEIDPTGDTLFILRKPDAPFAVDQFFKQWPSALPQYCTPQIQQNERHLRNSALAKTPRVNSTPEIHMRLSSKHLVLASAYFQKLMANDWMETNTENGYSYTITAEEWDKKALLILMNIIHGQTQNVDQSIDLEMLTKIAVLVDYYKCHKAVHFFANSWIGQLRQPLPSSYGRDLLLRLFVSYVFSEYCTFKILTKTIIYQSRGSIHTLGLAIPENIIDTLDATRQRLISGFISSLNELKAQLSKEENGCSFECSSMSLGALIKGMNAMRLLDPPPRIPFEGHSVLAIEKAISDIKSPNYNQPPCAAAFKSSMGYHTGGFGLQNIHNTPRDCNIAKKTEPIIKKQLDQLQGLYLGTFIYKQ